MGLHNNLKKSIRQSQSTLDFLIQQYQAMGFPTARIIQAWQECKQNQNNFHDTLIRIINEANSKTMNQQDLMKSNYQNQFLLQQKEQDDLKKATMLSLSDDAPDRLEDLEQLLKSKPGPSGLKNLGNTCFMNIMIQSFYNCVPFRNYVLSLQIPQVTTPGSLTLQKLQELFVTMQYGLRNWVSPQHFLEALSKFKPNTLLVQGQQNDYNELQVAFLDSIEAALKELVDEQQVKKFIDMFYGQSQDKLAYMNGDQEVNVLSDSTFGSITIDAKDKDLERGLRNSHQLVIDDYETEQGVKTTAKIQQNIKKAPQLMSFYINRVFYDPKQKTIAKNNQSLAFPQQINLNMFTANNILSQENNQKIQEYNQNEQEIIQDLQAYGEQEDELEQGFDNLIKLFKRSGGRMDNYMKFDDDVQIVDDNPKSSGLVQTNVMIENLEKYKKTFLLRRQILRKQLEQIQEQKKKILATNQNTYQLTAVLMHDGSAQSGHYYCYVLDKQNPGKWLKCNDRQVTQVEFTQVYMDAQGSNRYSANASGLIYELLNWFEEPQLKQLQPIQIQFLQKDEESLKTKIDQAKVLARKGNIQAKLSQQLLVQYKYQSEIVQRVEVFSRFDAYISEFPKGTKPFIIERVIQNEFEEMKNKLNYPQQWQNYIQNLQNQGKLVDQSEEQEYKQRYQIYLRLNNHLSNLEKSLILNLQIENFQDAIKQYDQCVTTFQKYDNRLAQAFYILFNAIVLRGCCFCDIMVQKENKDVVKVIKQINFTANESQNINPIIKKQIKQNIVYTVDLIEARKQYFNFGKTQQDQQSGIISSGLLPEALVPPTQDKDISQFLIKFQKFVDSMKPWIMMTKQIVSTGQLIDNQKRLDMEYQYYFQ
ncbi:hypothetical protein pb186bvf_003472 [Paramecium bursaria]